MFSENLKFKKIWNFKILKNFKKVLKISKNADVYVIYKTSKVVRIWSINKDKYLVIIL